MSATYNWAYRPGVTNKYGLTIAASADNVRPSNACYVALFGNDNTGNGSRQYPYRTLGKAFNISNTVIAASGVYRETVGTNAAYLYGDGDAIVDISYFIGSSFFPVNNFQAFNIKFLGNQSQSVVNGAGTGLASFIDCIFDGITPGGSNGVIRPHLINCVVVNCLFPLRSTSTAGDQGFLNCTFHRCSAIIFGNSTLFTNCIFSECNINVVSINTGIRYSLFHNCNFRFNAAELDPLTVYPSIPAGYTYYSDITALNTDYLATFPTAVNPLVSCIVADPMFNNSSIGDYTLDFSSPAKNLSYFGTYVGAYSIGQSLKVRVNENAGDFEFASSANFTISDDSLTLTDTTLDAQIDTIPIINILGREISRLPSFGFNADRNGQYIDSIADLSTTTYAAGDILPSTMPFIVEGGAVIYNGNTLQTGDRGTTVPSATAFSTTANGVLREITEAPQRHTIMARFSDGGSSVPTDTALTAGYYYYVVSGAVSYNNTTYNSGAIFKAYDTNSFSGTGTVKVAFSTEVFCHYEPGIKPTSNNFGDSRTGEIIRGNGDPSYDRGGLGIKEFPINAKFIQIRYIIRINNLKP